MSKTLTDFYAEVMREVFTDPLSLDEAVVLTHILDTYRLHFTEDCDSDLGSSDQTPVDWRLTDAAVASGFAMAAA